MVSNRTPGVYAATTAHVRDYRAQPLAQNSPEHQILGYHGTALASSVVMLMKGTPEWPDELPNANRRHVVRERTEKQSTYRQSSSQNVRVNNTCYEKLDNSSICCDFFF